MPRFNFIAKNSKGEIKRGEMDKKDEREVAAALRSEGFFATAISEEKNQKSNQKASVLRIFSGISLKDKMMFARHLGIMLSSGLSLPKAIRVIGNQTKSKRFKSILLRLEEEVKTGNPLAESLEKSGVFDELSINMIRVGEIGGNMEEVLNLLADQLEKEHNLMSKVRGAMYYPSVIIIVMICIGIAMMTFVIPKLMTIFDDMQASIPFTTKLIIDSSNFMASNKLLVFGSLTTFVIFIVLFLKSSVGKKIMGVVFLKMPVIKNVVIKVNNARFARIYSSLLRSGVPIVEALKINSNTLTNYYYKKSFSEIQEEVQKGKPLHAEMEKYPNLFPVLVVQMVEVGEETGKTVEILVDLAKFYEEEIDQVTKNLSSIIEPILMIVIGSAVGFFAVSMIMPMYSVMDQM